MDSGKYVLQINRHKYIKLKKNTNTLKKQKRKTEFKNYMMFYSFDEEFFNKDLHHGSSFIKERIVHTKEKKGFLSY